MIIFVGGSLFCTTTTERGGKVLASRATTINPYGAAAISRTLNRSTRGVCQFTADEEAKKKAQRMQTLQRRSVCRAAENRVVYGQHSAALKG